ncbi:hypothetical protein BP6252_05017 [Coleophoma cylindrospora]|uniref:Uncharacterized protein n=1 Tax=Coleophoma cylindrospora TaxID=1849047 RepID=A0A3D8RSW6_9HELO|nr:hypothetical protein BP6252_05017 [Coleophoma cylindrospora]
MSAIANRTTLGDIIQQSPPINVADPYEVSWLADKTILITGGASGFGEGFFRKWAEHGANVIIGDINDARGKALVAEVRKKTGNQNHHYIHCDVTDWQSQVDFFRSAAQLSPHKGIDAVVANAGIAESNTKFEQPMNLDAQEPPKPNLKTFEVNLLGVLYTAHLATFYLPRNPQSNKASPSSVPGPGQRDRHLLLISSVAGLNPIPGQPLYGISKHGVVGLFRQLRSTSFQHGIRVNMLCPYFIDTPLIPAVGRVILAGAGVGKPEDVVDAGTRLMADSRVCGRGLVIGPKVKTDAKGELTPVLAEDGSGSAVWECYADDFLEVEAFTARMVRLLNAVELSRGWAGWAGDMVKAVLYPVRAWWSR